MDYVQFTLEWYDGEIVRIGNIEYDKANTIEDVAEIVKDYLKEIYNLK